MTQTTKDETNKKIAIGAGVAAAAAAAAAGAYWLYGAKHSAQHRRMARGWMLKARSEVLDAVEKLQDIDKASYMRVVEDVLDRYSKKVGTTPGEIRQMLGDFRKAWLHMQVAQKQANRGATTATRATKRVRRTVRKSTSKKSS